MNELKEKAIEIFKNNPDRIGISILQLKLRIGIITANKLIESLENDGVISAIDENRKRKLLIK